MLWLPQGLETNPKLNGEMETEKERKAIEYVLPDGLISDTQRAKVAKEIHIREVGSINLCIEEAKWNKNWTWEKTTDIIWTRKMHIAL